LKRQSPPSTNDNFWPSWCPLIIPRTFLFHPSFLLSYLCVVRAVNATLHRWVLRAVTHGVDPDLVRYDPEQSLQFLKNWISTIGPYEGLDLDIKKQFLHANFDIGEYLLYGGDYASAESYLKKTHELHMDDSFKDSSRHVTSPSLVLFLLLFLVQ
jgi:hypothetical protein